jgi:hypothetical protein
MPFRPIPTNFTPVNVIGVPGLMLVLIAIALAWQFPEAQWLIAAGLAGGALVAVALIRRRATHPFDNSNDPWSHDMLGVNHDNAHRYGTVESNRVDSDRDTRRGAVRDRLVPLRGLRWTAGRA